MIEIRGPHRFRVRKHLGLRLKMRLMAMRRARAGLRVLEIKRVAMGLVLRVVDIGDWEVLVIGD